VSDSLHFDRKGPYGAEGGRVDEPADALPYPASVSLDGDGRISGASATAAAMLGYEPIALAGRTLTELAADGWRQAAEVATARVRYGSTEDFTLLLRGRSGRLSLIEMVARLAPPRRAAQDEFVLEWANGRPRRDFAPGLVEARLSRLAISLIQRGEGERLNVAKRLHDDLSPTLAATKYLVEDAVQRGGRGDRDQAFELLGQAVANLRHVIAELRNISNALRPRLLDDFGLLPTLEWYGRGFAEANPAVSTVRVLTAAEHNIPDFLKADIFRVVQDALGNVAQHSQASVVRLSLVEEDGELRLSIEDNGKGFDAVMAFQSSDVNVGLLSMRKRIQATGGRFALESRPQRGTRVAAAWAIGQSASGENGDAPYYPKPVIGNSIRH
jgi:two-component system, NarL family, sensor kinase